MASANQADESEDVTDFLRRIKELGDKRDREDAERTRKLEDDIIEGRKHREARRAERARSLSPEKSSPSTTPRSLRSPRNVARPEFASSPLNASTVPSFSATIGSVIEEPDGKSAAFPIANQLHSPSQSPTYRENQELENPESPTKALQDSSHTPSRSAALSWQQRPTSNRSSRTLDLKSHNGGPSASFPSALEPHGQNEEDPALSRDQIAQRLGSKDPSWFRQTEDRGVVSAAYRRNIRDAGPESPQAEKKALHGMSRESMLSVDRQQNQPLSTKTDSSTQNTSPPWNTAKDNTGDVIVPSSSDVTEGELFALEKSSRMLERPSSPSKVNNGFAQSALLKRSESINKRWSAQTPPGLNRQSSNASGRAYYGNDGLPSSISMPKLGDDNTSEHMSHPSSSHSNTTAHQGSDAFVRPALPQHKRSHSSINLRNVAQGSTTESATPTSPSKRWSPQKASWLESALNRPESPTPNSPTPKPGPPQQPAWMVELSRAKQQRATRDILDPTTSKSLEKESSTVEAGSFAVEKTTIQESTAKPQKPASPPSTKPKPATLMERSSWNSAKSSGDPATTTPVHSKTKPQTPPKKDFRSQLRSSELLQDKPESQEPEFLNAFGKLKRTQTEKYVAPDELKSNILRGKSALAVTGGPQKTQRRDELKESLVQQREAMKAKANDTPTSEQQFPTATIAIPEAIAKKQALGRNDSSGNIMSAPKTSKENNQALNDEIEEKATPLSPASSTVAGDRSPPKFHAAVSNSSLASKFNTGLANVIARGPLSSANAEPSRTPSRPSPPTNSPSARLQLSESSNQVGQLQHMTKGRARGPKRRLPKAGSSAPPTESTSSTPAPPPKNVVPSLKPAPPIKPLNITSSMPTIQAGNSTLESQRSILSKPPPPFKSPQLRKAREQPSLSEPASPSRAASISASTSVKDSAALWGQASDLRRNSHQQPAQKNARALKEDEDLNRLKEISTALVGPSSSFQASKPRAELPASSPETLNGSSVPTKLRVDASSRSLTVPQPKSPKPPHNTTTPQSTPLSGPGRLLAEFFDGIAVAPTKLDVDSSIILRSNPQTPGSKTNTLKKEISELGTDGKTIPVPSSKEHVLYSKQMYLCTHVFEEPTGSRVAEVYLWAGSAIADAAVEDAQLFARKAAKDAGGKLLIVRQGKEPANFFQALGGILISRWGSTRDSLSSYMLCGRQHLGHLAFDEVQLSASSLCSGFPYIIVAGPERVFLWRGSGCNSEELAGARLISMDVGPSGKVTEVGEGSEPSDLMAVLSGASAPGSADHWKLKTKYDNYRSRLFHVEYNERPISRQDSGPAALWNLVRRRSQADLASSSGTQINEILPFAQSDLQNENIYVLDAFFEIYIILGSMARSKSQAFGSALLFAQEYAVLAASSENRPYVPVSTVVLEGAPRDLKRVFRQWDDSLMPMSKAIDGNSAKMVKSLKVMPLAQALGALRSAT